MPQTLELQTIPAIPTPQVFAHIVTLRHPRTEDEQDLVIETLSDRFVDVLREVTHQRVMRGLLGYDIYQVLADYDEF